MVATVFKPCRLSSICLVSNEVLHYLVLALAIEACVHRADLILEQTNRLQTITESHIVKLELDGTVAYSFRKP
jgi:hypothetical protein